jgi:hypothetical protein
MTYGEFLREVTLTGREEIGILAAIIGTLFVGLTITFAIVSAVSGDPTYIISCALTFLSCATGLPVLWVVGTYIYWFIVERGNE